MVTAPMRTRKQRLSATPLHATLVKKAVPTMPDPTTTPAQRCAQRLAQALNTTAALAPAAPADLADLTTAAAIDLRQRELQAIDDLLREIDRLYRQQSFIDERGLVEDLCALDTRDVPRASVLESVYEQPLPALTQLSLAQGLDLISEEYRCAHLGRALTWRRCLIIAYRLLLVEPLARCHERALDPEWLSRWRHAAEHSRHDELQEVWARVLIAETCGQAHFSFADLHALQLLSVSDIATLRLLARCLLAPGLWRDTHGYFRDSVHGPLLQSLEEQGLLLENARVAIALTQTGSMWRGVLYCRNKALFISAPRLPELSIQRVSARARRLMQLWPEHADTAYLFALGQALKNQGCEVDLGDCSEQEQGLFIERASL